MLLSDPQLVRVPGPARYAPIDLSLTEPTPDPVPPAPLCVDSDGAAVLCDSQVTSWLEAYRFALEKANVDKALIREISSQIVEDQEVRSGGRD